MDEYPHYSIRVSYKDKVMTDMKNNLGKQILCYNPLNCYEIDNLYEWKSFYEDYPEKSSLDKEKVSRVVEYITSSKDYIIKKTEIYRNRATFSKIIFCLFEIFLYYYIEYYLEISFPPIESDNFFTDLLNGLINIKYIGLIVVLYFLYKYVSKLIDCVLVTYVLKLRYPIPEFELNIQCFFAYVAIKKRHKLRCFVELEQE